MVNWHLIFTKPKQEIYALDNLQRLGFECYFPTVPAEKMRQGQITASDEPLFPRYLFIRLGLGDFAKSWASLRSTRGVIRLVNFAVEPAKVDNQIIDLLRQQEALVRSNSLPLLIQSEWALLSKASFAGLEGIYQMTEGERRVMVLIEILSKTVALNTSPDGLLKSS